MKIRCDACDKEEASVFCSADEAALCDGCDRRVHHANKLASKHSRFSLLQPAFKESPLCDICQERRAFLFCQEDRAILCRECDVPIHKANEHTQKHNRFLLTGVKLSASSSLYQNPSTSSTTTTTSSEAATNAGSRTPFSTTTKRLRTVSTEISSSSSIENPFPYGTYKLDENNSASENGPYSTSSISEYLMETLPGWHVEDFLDPCSSASINGFCKTDHNNGRSVVIMDDDDDGDFDCNNSSFSSQELANWVPQLSTQSPQNTTLYHSNNGVFYAAKADDIMMMFNFNPKWDSDACCIVPRITSPPSLKRHRHFNY
ncbi:B-box-type zinc finger [Parasponia andersonii]|uniref:B-box-type zinc finger n=1 Tax=Parasponia andersonii TaxID=3476 RepID=A0A2P5E5K9_PARAD|nr:B-box-type zinc finger [Parasponia andersonii]